MINKIKLKIYKTLKWSEKFTQTDMIYLAKGGLWLTSNRIIGSLSALALSIAYANLLPKEDYATYKYILSIAGILGIFVLPGIDSSLLRSIALGFNNSYKKAIKEKMKWGLLATFIGVVVASYYLYQGNTVLFWGVLAAAIFFPLVNSFMLYGIILQGQKKFKESAIYNSTKQVLITVAIISTLFITSSISIFIIVYYFIDFLLTYIVFKKVTKNINDEKENTKNKNEENKMLSFGKHLSLMNILGITSEHIDKILMWHFLGPVNLAVYSFAIIPINQATGLLKPAAAMAFPKIIEQETDAIKKTLPNKLLKFSLLISLGVLLYYFIAPPAYNILFPEYLEAVKYSQVYAILLIFFPNRILSHLIVKHANTKYLYISNIVSSIFKIIILVIFLLLWGIWGVILSFLISGIFNFLINYYFFRLVK